MPDLLAAPFFLAASLLVLGGLVKIRRPAAASRAMAAARLPDRWWQVRILGTLEIAVGLWALLAPSAASAVAVAVLYLGFAVFLTVLIAAHVPAASCGCAGADAPPSVLHVVLDLAAVATAALAAANPIPSVGAFLFDEPLLGVPLAVATAAAGYAAYLAVTLLPILRVEVHRSSALGHRHGDGHRHDHPPSGLLQVASLERSA